MKRIDPEYVVKGTGGSLYSRAENGMYDQISSVAIDNRKIREECLFFCIIGERVDAHVFLPDVREKGCHNIVVSDESWAKKMSEFGDMNIVLVDDTVAALDALTAQYLKDWADLKKVAITGSAGKTTTKEFTYSVLSTKNRTAKNTGNLNSETGIPLAVFDYPEDSEIAIVEIGIGSGPDMRELVSMVKPDNAIITNVGTVHMEFFESSREKLLEAKLRVALGFGPDNTLVVNNNNDNLSVESVRIHTEGKGYRIVTVGDKADSDYRITEIEDRGIDGVRGKLIHDDKEYMIEIPIVGAHNLFNAAEAIAMGEVYGISVEEGLQAVRNIDLPGSRLDIRRGKYTILNDAYNANPEAMKATITTIRNSSADRKGLILGSMGELGDEGPELHREVGRFIAEGGIDYVITVGELAELIADEIRVNNSNVEVMNVANYDELMDRIHEVIREGDLFLVKGSNSIGLYRLAENLEN